MKTPRFSLPKANRPFQPIKTPPGAAALRGALLLFSLHAGVVFAELVETTVDLGDYLELDADALSDTPHVFRGDGQLILDGDLKSGTTTFRDTSLFEIGLRSSLMGGTQHFRDDSTLKINWLGRINGGTQIFADRSTLSVFDEIQGGRQFFHDESTLSLGRGFVITGGEQVFTDKSRLIFSAPNPIKGGIQTFRDDSRADASVLSSIQGGTQLFFDRSTLNIDAANALGRNDAVFNDESQIRLNADRGIAEGTSIALNDNAGLHMLGHSVSVDTVESLDFQAQAFVQNGGDTDAVITVNPQDVRQPFFNGHMRDGGTGKLGLTKDGPRTFYLAGEQAVAYSGDTEVKAGVLAIRGVAPSASHKNVLLNGGWLDISELSTDAADQFELKGSHPDRVLRAADHDIRSVAAGAQESVSQPLGSDDAADHGKYLVKTGPGKLTLEAENHYIGATRVQEGILSFSKNEQLGQEAVVRSLVLEGGSLELTADIDTDRTIELRTTGVVDTTATASQWRSVLQDAQPRTLVKRGSGPLTFKEESHLGSVVVEDGSLSFLDTPKIRAAAGQPAVVMGAAADSASFVSGLIQSQGAPAIVSDAGNSRVNLLLMEATAKDAPLARTHGSAELDIEAVTSKLAGTLEAQGDSSLQLTLDERSAWSGAAAIRDTSRIHVALAGPATRWNILGDATVTNLANIGTLQFGSADLSAGTPPTALPSLPADYATLHVQGDYTGGGTINMRTKVNGDHVFTDRFLIEGDASGITQLDVALEKTGKQHRLSSVSLVQVGGNANADSFQLKQGEIMLKGSPFKHVLDAYGPRELAGKHGRSPDWMLDKKPSWDFRLQIAKETPLGFIVPPVHPRTPDANPDADHQPAVIAPPEKDVEDEKDVQADTPIAAEPPITPEPQPEPNPLPPHLPQAPKTRAKLVPQASAYLAAPRGLQNYQTEITAALHQQLNDDRERAGIAPDRAYDGYARVIGLSHSYRSNLDWASHGIDFRQKSQALQLGGTLLRKPLGDHTVTLGAAATLGSTSIGTQGQPAERANARFDTRDVALTAGLSHCNGFYLDGIVAIGNFDGKVKAGSRHPSAKPHGHSSGVSLAAGKTVPFGNGLVLQPQLQWQYRRLSFAPITDKNDIDIKVGTSDSQSLSAGVHLSWPQAGGAWTPYAQAHLLTGWGSTPTVQLSGNDFDTGRAGQAAQLTVGARAELGKSTSLHGAVTGRTRLGDAGASGVAGTIGVRHVF